MDEDKVQQYIKDKVEVISTPYPSPFLPFFTFWAYKTQEDKMARNFWLGLIIGFLVFSSLTLYLLKIGNPLAQ